MKPIISALVLALTLSGHAWANSYHGKITATVTSFSNVPQGTLAAGDAFPGRYHYDSPTIDGFFYGESVPPGYYDFDGWLTLPLIGGVTFDDSAFHPWLSVSGGVVTGFSYDPTFGPIDVNIGASSFSIYAHWDAGLGADPEMNVSVNGAVSFGDPVVPDSAMTCWLLAGSIACLVAARSLLRGAAGQPAAAARRS